MSILTMTPVISTTDQPPKIDIYTITPLGLLQEQSGSLSSILDDDGQKNSTEHTDLDTVGDLQHSR